MSTPGCRLSGSMLAASRSCYQDTSSASGTCAPPFPLWSAPCTSAQIGWEENTDFKLEKQPQSVFWSLCSVGSDSSRWTNSPSVLMQRGNVDRYSADKRTGSAQQIRSHALAPLVNKTTGSMQKCGPVMFSVHNLFPTETNTLKARRCLVCLAFNS